MKMLIRNITRIHLIMLTKLAYTSYIVTSPFHVLNIVFVPNFVLFIVLNLIVFVFINIIIS